MDYDRLRELQEKFDESPRRYFAPLANEYRKGGQPKRAIEICRAHLAQMPGHMSGQIVFAQALFDAGEWAEARTVFERALALDPENLIALRSLGDMALQAGNTAEARSWYARLLDADPKDTVVIALVSEIDASTEAAGDQQISTVAPEAAHAVETSASETVESASATETPAVEPASLDVEEPLGLERHYPAESAEEVRLAEPPVAEQASSSAEPESPAAAEPAAASEEPAFTGASAEPFVNETMAQLYLQQGYRQLALKVYRQLSGSRPHDQSLKDRIAEIDAADAADHPGEAPVMRREEPPIESPAPPTAPPSRDRESIEAPAREKPRAEPEGKGIGARQPSIREFFATLGRRRPPRASGHSAMRAGISMPPDSGESMGNSAPGASLDGVFAGATVSPSDARAASRLAGAFSGATGGSRTPPTPPVPTPRLNPRLPQAQESEEDVAKFRAWLDGLTRE